MYDGISGNTGTLQAWGIAISYREPAASISLKNAAIPNDYKLHQNYPNPFNPSTQIVFYLPKKSLVKLNIYNALGQKVVSLVNEILTAGKYHYCWKPMNLASGIYFYSIQTEDFRSVKKMLLVK